jgi:hypothetical protein
LLQNLKRGLGISPTSKMDKLPILGHLSNACCFATHLQEKYSKHWISVPTGTLIHISFIQKFSFFSFQKLLVGEIPKPLFRQICAEKNLKKLSSRSNDFCKCLDLKFCIFLILIFDFYT